MAHPRIWNVPHPRNPLLVGRTDELEELRRTFGMGGIASAREQGQVIAGPIGATPIERGEIVALTQILTGLGGIGKTSVATEYCHAYSAQYDVVWWVRAAEPATLASDYAALAAKLDPRAAGEPSQPLLIEFVRDWLRQHDGWLLVFDNANAPDEIRAYLPMGGKGHTLVTSREPGWENVGKLLPVRVLPRAESIRFLTNDATPALQATANDLALELGDLPLALEHARAYVAQTGISLVGYLGLYRSRRVVLLGAVDIPLAYHATIATTWDISLEQAAAQVPASVDLLTLCAFFAPDEIPLDVMIAGAKYLPEPFDKIVQDPLELNRAIRALRHFSLIERQDNLLSVHRLVQQITRDRLAAEDYTGWAATAVAIVDEAYPFESGDARTWSECARLLPHALVCTALADSTEAVYEFRGRLLNKLGIYLKGRADFIQAKTLFERALVIREQEFGDDSIELVPTLNNLGIILLELGDPHGARDYFARAVQLLETSPDYDPWMAGICIGNYGLVQKDLGENEIAKTYLERGIELLVGQVGEDNATVGALINNLGMVLLELDDVAGAKTQLDRAYRILNPILGHDHPSVGTLVGNLGFVAQQQGDLATARDLYVDALQILETALGENHPDVANVLHNYGVWNLLVGDKVSAQTLLERALAIFQNAYGMEHPITRAAQTTLDDMDDFLARNG